MKTRADVVVDFYEELDPLLAKEQGIGLLICDLDFTLAPRWCRKPTENLVIWINRMLDNGIEIVIVSNNSSRRRIEKFANDKRLRKPLPYMFKAGKPKTDCVEFVARHFPGGFANIALLGDRESRDVACAKNAGVQAWKVRHRLKF